MEKTIIIARNTQKPMEYNLNEIKDYDEKEEQICRRRRRRRSGCLLSHVYIYHSLFFFFLFFSFFFQKYQGTWQLRSRTCAGRWLCPANLWGILPRLFAFCFCFVFIFSNFLPHFVDRGHQHTRPPGPHKGVSREDGDSHCQRKLNNRTKTCCKVQEADCGEHEFGEAGKCIKKKKNQVHLFLFPFFFLKKKSVSSLVERRTSMSPERPACTLAATQFRAGK